MKTDNKVLLDDVERCFELAVAPGIPASERKKYDDRGWELRARLTTLLAAEFADGTQQVTTANAKIREVNKLLKARLTQLGNAANTIQALGELVSVIDDLFQLPFIFK